MALPSLATIDDLEAWQGAKVDSSRAGAVLAAASTLVRAKSGRVWVGEDGVEEGVSELALDTVRTVCLTVADRVFRNPQGARQQVSGPFSQSLAEWATQGLRLTPEESALLASAAGRVPGLGSVRVTAPAQARGTVASKWHLTDPCYDPCDGDC
jgi:hypothetical protein